MAELKEKKFGYVVNPPPGPHKHIIPHIPGNPFMQPPPPPVPLPPGMTMQDWMAYINSYIDVRARQLYDRLKDIKESTIDAFNFIVLVD